MISKIDVADFRCLHKFELSPDKINILVGRNNTGKSSVLEAITIAESSTAGYRDALGQEILSGFAERRDWNLQYFVRLGSVSSRIRILSGSQKSSIPIEVNMTYSRSASGLSPRTMAELRVAATEKARVSKYRKRSPEKNRRLDTSATDAEKAEKETENQIVFAMDELLKQQKLVLNTRFNQEILFQEEQASLSQYNENPPPTEHSKVLFTGTGFESDLNELHDLLVPTPLFAPVMENIKRGIPYLMDLRPLDNEIFVYQKNVENPIPITLMGDGFRDVLRILFISALTTDGTAIFEEPENSLHPGFLSLVAEYMARAAIENRTQFFISTHSMEFLQYVLEKGAEFTKVIRMSQTNGQIAYEVMTGKEALDETKQIGTDLRGV